MYSRLLVVSLFFWIPATSWAFVSKVHQSGDKACLRCHGNAAPRSPSAAPELAQQFSMQWNMYEFLSADRPPHSEMPDPHTVLRGTTHYDWSQFSMTEIYLDKCIDIFPSGRDFPCQFLSIRENTYLIRFEDSSLSKAASCCRWSDDEFWAPRPDVIQNMLPDKSRDELNDWWILDTPLPGPFGFGFKMGAPKAFWFPVISGWVQQEFHTFSATPPPVDAFSLPEICKEKIQLCK